MLRSRYIAAPYSSMNRVYGNGTPGRSNECSIEASIYVRFDFPREQWFPFFLIFGQKIYAENHVNPVHGFRRLSCCWRFLLSSIKFDQILKCYGIIVAICIVGVPTKWARLLHESMSPCFKCQRLAQSAENRPANGRVLSVLMGVGAHSVTQDGRVHRRREFIRTKSIRSRIYLSSPSSSTHSDQGSLNALSFFLIGSLEYRLVQKYKLVLTSIESTVTLHFNVNRCTCVGRQANVSGIH